MKTTLLITLCLACSGIFAQVEVGEWTTIYREDDNGELFRDSMLVLKPGQKAPEGVMVTYRDNKGRNVNADGTYEYIYREDDNGEIFQDSVRIED